MDHQADDLYRAVGCFMVHFSHLQHMAEFQSVVPIQARAEIDRAELTGMLWSIVSDRTAQPVMNAFFSICAILADQHWTEDDRAVLKTTRTVDAADRGAGQ